MSFRASNAFRFIPPRRGLNFWSGSLNGGFGMEFYGTLATFFDSTKRATLRATGVDGLRLNVALSYLANADSSTLATYLANIIATVQAFRASGFKVLVELAPDGNGYDNLAIFDGVAGTKWSRVNVVYGQLAAALQALRDPVNIAIETPNEPGLEASYPGGTFVAHMAVLKNTLRANYPTGTIYIGSSNGQDKATMTALDGTLFSDPAIGASFHFYPEPYTQQSIGGAGYHRSLQGLEYPPNPANKAAQLAALSARMSTYGVSGGEASALTADVTAYYDDPRDATWFAGQLTGVSSWATTRGLVGKVICSEWAVTGDTDFGTPYTGMDASSRVTAIGVHRAAFEAAGFAHWMNQLLGWTNFKTGQGVATGDGNFTLDSAALAALCPP